MKRFAGTIGCSLLSILILACLLLLVSCSFRSESIFLYTSLFFPTEKEAILTTYESFCKAIRAADYEQAFSYTSPHFRNSYSSRELGMHFADVKYESCALHNSYELIVTGQTAHLYPRKDPTFTFYRNGPVYELVAVQGQWLIDSRHYKVD